MENPQEQLHERIEISREADTVSAFAFLAALSIGSESSLSFLPYIQLRIVFRAPQSLQLPKTHVLEEDPWESPPKLTSTHSCLLLQCSIKEQPPPAKAPFLCAVASKHLATSPKVLLRRLEELFRLHQLHAACPGRASNCTKQQQSCTTTAKHRHRTCTAPSALGALGMGLRGRSYIQGMQCKSHSWELPPRQTQCPPALQARCWPNSSTKQTKPHRQRGC